LLFIEKSGQFNSFSDVLEEKRGVIKVVYGIFSLNLFQRLIIPDVYNNSMLK